MSIFWGNKNFLHARNGGFKPFLDTFNSNLMEKRRNSMRDYLLAE